MQQTSCWLSLCSHQAMYKLQKARQGFCSKSVVDCAVTNCEPFVNRMTSRMVTLLVMLCFCLRNDGCSKVMAMSAPTEEDLELERELQSLNKPPVKTIQVLFLCRIKLDGDIIDCVDINHQPALDHPLLKNHKIQLRPTSIPATQTKKSALVNKPLQAGFMQAGCPNGTVPIHRTTKEYLTRAKSLSHQMFSNISQINAIAPNVHQVFLKINGSMLLIRYVGVLGSGSIFRLNVAQDQSSTTHVWVDSGRPYYVTRLIAGCLVSPSINGDSEPRLFIYWTLNADKTGCFNSLCQGFVQLDRDIGPKTRFDPVSSFGGKTYDSKFAIYQDFISKNWWLVVSDKNVAIGYWPKELVPSLEIGAGDVGWGGIAMAQENENAPPLGSGQYPDGTYQHVGYFRDIHFMKDGLHPKVPTDADAVFEYAEVPCGLQNNKDSKIALWGYRFGFGGPGGNCTVV